MSPICTLLTKLRFNVMQSLPIQKFTCFGESYNQSAYSHTGCALRMHNYIYNYYYIGLLID